MRLGMLSVVYPAVDDALAREVMAATGAGSAELRVAEGASPFEQRRRTVATGPYEELRARIDDGVPA